MLYELDVLPGLKELALEELAERFGDRARLLPDDDDEALRFEWEGAPAPILSLRLAAAAHRALHFAIRRPRQLLGDQDFRRLASAVAEVRDSGPFTALRFSAAGAGSSVFRRLKSDLAAAVALPTDDEGGDLLLRVRPSQFRQQGWDVLIRLTNRPLATRAWRLANMPGSINGTVAAAMVRLSRPEAQQRVLNLMCGSGALMAERSAAAASRLLAGCDIDPEALRLARANLEGPVLLRADASSLPFPRASFEVLLADLPWGNLSGSHAGNLGLYPRVLAEAARVASPVGRFVLITHEIRLLERCLDAQSWWRSRAQLAVLQGGAHPRIQLLERTG